MIRKGDVIVFKPEWQDTGDANRRFVAIEDEQDGRVGVTDASSTLTIPGWQMVSTYMIVGGPDAPANQ